MKREEIKEKIPEITTDALDWLMARQGQELQKLHSETDSLAAEKKQLEAKLAEAGARLADYDPDWKQKAKAESLSARLSAQVKLAGGRSEKAIFALLDRDAIAAAPDPAAAAEQAVQQLRQSHSYLFEPAAAAAYSAGSGCAAPAETPDAALRAAFGLPL